MDTQRVCSSRRWENGPFIVGIPLSGRNLVPNHCEQKLLLIMRVLEASCTAQNMDVCVGFGGAYVDLSSALPKPGSLSLFFHSPSSIPFAFLFVIYFYLALFIFQGNFRFTFEAYTGLPLPSMGTHPSRWETIVFLQACLMSDILNFWSSDIPTVSVSVFLCVTHVHFSPVFV